MSYEPTCLGVDYTNKFFEPQFSTVPFQNILHQQDNVQISWYGGRGATSAPQKAALVLAVHGTSNFINIVGKQSQRNPVQVVSYLPL